MKKWLLPIGMMIAITMLTACSLTRNYYQDGKNDFVDGKYEEAALNFTKAIAGNPNRADYYIDYGMALIELGEYDKALEQFDRAYLDKEVMIIRENNKRVHRGKGIAYYRMLQYQEAIKQFEEALNLSELSELDMDILYYMGKSYSIIGAYEQAIKAYTSILTGDDKNAIAYGDRALCYKNLGDYDKSLADYESAITLKPNNYDYYFGKYYLLAESLKETAAKEVLTQAAKIEVKTKEDKYNQAKVHFFQEDYKGSLTELNEGVINGFLEAYYYIGEIHRIEKEYAEAVYYYDIFIKDGVVKVPNVYNQAASCLIKLGDYQKAIEYLEKGIACNDAGMMRVLKKNEIIAYENLGLFNDAKVKLEEYLVSYPEDEDAIREEEFIKTRLIEFENENKNEKQ